VTLRSKLLLAQAPLVLALLLVSAAGSSITSSLGRASHRILKDNYRSVLAMQRMKDALRRMDEGALLGDRREADRARFAEELAVQEGNITEPGEREATARLHAAWDEYRQGLDRGLATDSRLQRSERVHQAIDVILALNQDAMVRKSDEADRTARRFDAILIAAAIAGFILAVYATATLTTRLLRPVSVLGQAARRIGEGDLVARARVEGKDEIAQLSREFNTMADRLQQYRQSSLGELIEAQQASQAAIDSLPDPVLVLSSDGKVLNVNQAAETLLRVEVGRDPLSGLPPALREAVDKVRAHIFGGKGAYAPRGLEEAIRVEGDGGGRALLPRATPLYSEQGNVTGATIVLQDVTRLLRFDELKNDLVATVAHEFRTPLTSMRMAVHILLEGTVGPLNEKQLDLVSAARDDSERLQGIVEDLLDLSRIEAGKVEVSLTALPAKSIVDAALDGKVQSAGDAGLKVEEELVEPVLPVLVDPERIGLVFDNLIGNAVRHSPKGGRILVRARPESGFVRFEVEDQGPGIPPEYQQRVFEKFFRMPGTKGEGIGLGLYISREIVAAHGGQMGVDSEPGHGSRFWFTLRVPSLPPPRV